MRFIDLSGKKFGKITVLERIKKENSKRTFFNRYLKGVANV